MKIVAAVMTHNVIRSGRQQMATDAIWALGSEADEIIVWDNGSTDGTEDWVASIHGHCDQPADGNTTTGRGQNNACTAAAKRGDVVVFAPEDVVYRPGWRAVVEEFFTHAGPDVAILCGLMEPEYPWSKPVGVYQAGEVRALERMTVPGGGWIFRSSDWPTIGPVPEVKSWDDVPTCQRLFSLGRKLVAVDLADHVGEHSSTWGNSSHAFAKPLQVQGLGLTGLYDSDSDKAAV